MASKTAASAGWIRVAAGLRMVAAEVSSLSASEMSEATSRVAQHAVELLANVRTATEAATSVPNKHEFEIRQTEAVQVLPDEQTRKLKTPNATSDLLSTNTSTHAERQLEKDSILNKTNDETDTSQQNGEAAAGLHDNSKAETCTLPKGSSKIAPNEQRRQEPHLAESSPSIHRRLQEGRAVPSTQIGRAMGFASLGVGLVMGTAAEAASRLFQKSAPQNSNSMIVTDANADRLSATLCRMRGAALKLGQMLSIQDESMLPPALSRALKQVRQGADAMPLHQLQKQMETQIGNKRDIHLESFDELPFAAASIGQVHLGTLKNSGKRVVLKVQYPGVADSIDSDLNNLQTLIGLTGLAPPGLFLENVIRVGRTELKQECDYTREAENQERFQRLVHGDDILQQNRFSVPSVVRELSTAQILTSEYAPGGTIDKVSNLNQEEKNRIGRTIMYLTMQELFVWRFMQTDPNWGNFLYDVGTGTTYLIDFGATREYPKEFVDGYLRIVWAAANQDADTIMHYSRKLGFLTGDENSLMVEAHKASGFTVGEPFRAHTPFDFRGSNISSRLSQETSVFLEHRLTPPPEEIYTLHRKLAGAYMLCIKLGAVITCRDMLEDIVLNHVFEDGTGQPEAYATSNNLSLGDATGSREPDRREVPHLRFEHELL